jgi:hypothetical protein
MNNKIKIKAIAIFFSLMISTAFLFSQQKEPKSIKIDTIEFNYYIKDIVNITSFIPQLSGNINSIAKDKINLDLKEYFEAGFIKTDSSVYVKKLLEEYDLNSLNEYFDIKKQISENDPTYREAKGEESFAIEYISDNLLNISISYQIYPYLGKYQYFFKSVCYDLQTGNKLKFSDFFTLQAKKLGFLFKKYGYQFEWNNDIMGNVKKKIDQNNKFNVDTLLSSNALNEELCTEFYFKTYSNEIYLMLKSKCEGPYLVDYGIQLSKLSDYIKYFEFKNKLKLWGKNIYKIKGYDYTALGRLIEFDDYTLINSGGGYLLPIDKNKPDVVYSISICSIESSYVYLFLKHTKDNNIKNSIITDLLEIGKTILTTNTKLMEFCETQKGADAEIIALVEDKGDNPIYYSNIIKAWKANRKTEKFERIKKKKVIKCGNESY